MTRVDSSDPPPYACHGHDACMREHEERPAHRFPTGATSENARTGERAEWPGALRTPFALDRHRIIECTAFRRLEGKTQVFAPSHHDHFRTRLTHTLEASHIARTLARALHANEDLAEAITLAHDLGHPPFGHAGEKALNEAMAGAGGFNHNLHALRVVEYLEHPFPAFRGLNLTAATRLGLSLHVTTYDVPVGRDSAPAPSVEAQVSSLADRIAYNCHDLEDAIGAEFVDPDHLRELSLWCHACDVAGVTAKTDRMHAIRRPVLDAMLDAMLRDAVENSAPRLAEIKSLEKVAQAKTPLVTLSETMDASLREVEQFLANRVYHHASVATGDAQGQEKILALFAAFRSNPSMLPPRFAARIKNQGVDRVVCDYIAGMTDRYCDKACTAIVRD